MNCYSALDTKSFLGWLFWNVTIDKKSACLRILHPNQKKPRQNEHSSYQRHFWPNMNDFLALSPKAEWPSLSGKSERTRRRRYFLRRHFTGLLHLVHYCTIFLKRHSLENNCTIFLCSQDLDQRRHFLRRHFTHSPARCTRNRHCTRPLAKNVRKLSFSQIFPTPTLFVSARKDLRWSDLENIDERHCTSLYQAIQAQGFSVTRRWLKLSHSSFFIP